MKADYETPLTIRWYTHFEFADDRCYAGRWRLYREIKARMPDEAFEQAIDVRATNVSADFHNDVDVVRVVDTRTVFYGKFKWRERGLVERKE